MKTFFVILLQFFFLNINAQNTPVNENGLQDSVKKHLEVWPKYPGGEAAMMEFIVNNLNYPSKARRNGIQGKVIVKFIVDAEGRIKDIKTVNTIKLGYGLEEAAMEVIKKMPLWIPGTIDGKAVSVYFNIPIRFRLDR